MAKAERRSIPQPLPAPVVEIVLTLTELEARVLSRLVAEVGGVPGTWRDQTLSIHGALENVGIRWARTLLPGLESVDIYAQGPVLPGFSG